MTCEIAIMNRQAIALAADSAMTVTYLEGTKRIERYFKGANKIFQLSNYHPVGIMIYGSSTLHEVPWELIVKDFRNYLRKKAFNTLEEYAAEFFAFIEGHERLFPVDFQDRIFREEAYKAVLLHIIEAHEAVKQATDKAAAYRDFFANKFAEVSQKQPHERFTQEDLDAALARHRTSLESQVEELLASISFEAAIEAAIDRSKLVEFAIRGLFATPEKLFKSTGIVIAGFGDHDYFPRYAEYECFALLQGKLMWRQKERKEISPVNYPAHIKAFAMTDMVDTFQIGISPDVFTAARSQWAESLRAVIGMIGKDLPGAENAEELIGRVLARYTDLWFKAAWEAHALPLLRVVGSLPIDEMANLAETLVQLQSLKEKVTKPTESVGGPIDVAVISKSDGFIWIKRKHYFEASLNPRFFIRQREAGRS